MMLDNLFSKLEILWSDALRWARFLSLFFLFMIWLMLGMFLGLSTMGRIPPLSPGLTALWKYATVMLIILVETFYIGVKYLQDIYEVPRARHTFKYLIAAIFQFNLPKIKIAGGQKEFKGEYNLIEHIGGPGILQVGRDNVVVLETLQTQKNVMVAGERPITRFDLVRDILSTEEQFGKIEGITTLTADGIQVTIQNVQFRFRIDGHAKPLDSEFQAKEYVPLKKAVIQIVYNRPVNAEGVASAWTDSVSGTVTGIIRGHVNNACLDDLIAPNYMGEHSLEALRRKFTSQQIHDQFKGMGVRLLSCNIGEIYIGDPKKDKDAEKDNDKIDIDQERLNAWFVRQSGMVKVISAYGNAENFASHERGRTEGQAMLLKSIAHALQDIGIQNGKTSVKKNLHNILLTRTAQILEARTSVYNKRVKEESQHDSKRSL
jgi:hypothetical protein